MIWLRWGAGCLIGVSFPVEWDFCAVSGAACASGSGGQRVQHRVGSDVAGPFVGVGGAVSRFPFAALLLFAQQMAVGSERGADHLGVLRV